MTGETPSDLSSDLDGSRARGQMALPGFRHSRAVFIAIDGYGPDVPDLTTPVRDAEALARALATDHGFDTEVLANSGATCQAIRDYFQDLAYELSGEDRVLVYFAGHGMALEGEGGPEGFLLLSDARRSDPSSFLPMAELHALLHRLPCRHLLVVLDCCFAGAFRWSGTRSLELAPGTLSQERFEWFIRDRAWQAIASAAHDQKALDVISGEPLGARGERGGHSPFAAALIEGLAGDADLPSHSGATDGVITATELFLYVESRLAPGSKAMRQRQSPALWPLPKHAKGQFVFLAPGRSTALPPAPPLDPAHNPWRGLQPYEPRHADLFFGRRTIVDALVERVRSGRGDGLTVVTGPSGVGKSSLVKAGLLPALGETFRAIVLRPGANPASPFEHLAEALASHGGGLTSAALAASTDALSTWLAGQRDPQPVLLVVDQAEELLTTCRDLGAVTRFFELLDAALAAQPARLRVVLTVRAEFEPQFVQIALSGRWAGARFLVPPMTPDELRRVVEGPAAVRAIRFEPPELVDQLVNEVVQMPGALPLLSYALSEMYLSFVARGHPDRAMTPADYDALQGGVAGSLRVRANLILAAQDEPQRMTTRRVLSRFVSVETGEFTRRQVPADELDVADAQEQERVAATLARLDEARLVVSDEFAGMRRTELAHDALIQGWERLSNWIREDAPLILDLRRLTRDANVWEVSGRKQSGLLWSNEARVATIRRLQASSSIALSRSEARFAAASIRQARLNRLVGLMAVAAIVLVSGAAVYNFLAGREARDLALHRRYAGDMASVARAWSAGDLAATEQLLAAYAKPAGSADPRTFEWYAYQRVVGAGRSLAQNFGDAVLSGAISPDGAQLAASSQDSSVAIFDLRSGRRVQLSAATVASHALQFSEQDGALVVGGDGELRIWSPVTPGEGVIPLSGGGPVAALALRPGGREGVAVDTGGRVYRLSLTTRTATRAGGFPSGSGYSFKAVYSLDAQTLVLANREGRLELWDATTLKRRRVVFEPGARLEGTWAAGPGVVLFPAADRVGVLDVQTGEVSKSAYMGGIVSTVGFRDSVLAVGGNWSGVEVWRVGQLRRPDTWEYVGVGRGFRGWPSSTLLLPGAAQLAATTHGGDVMVWDVSAVGSTSPVKHASKLIAAMPLPNDDIVSADEGGVVRRWRLPAGAPRWSTRLAGEINAAAAAPKIGLIIAAKEEGGVQVLDASNGAVRARFDGYGPVAGAAMAPRLAWTTDRGIALLSTLSPYPSPTTITLPPKYKDADISALALSPSGDLIAVGIAGGEVVILDARTARVLSERNLARGDVVWALTFSPNGRRLAVAVDKAVRIIDASDGRDIAHLVEHWTDVFSLAFSPDGKTLASGDRDGAVRLWNTNAWQSTISYSKGAGHNRELHAVAFSRKGDALVVGSESGSVSVYRASPRSP